MDTKEKRKVNKLLSRVKINSYKLKESGSLPLFLYKRICNLGADSSLDEVQVYITLAERYLRVSGYYFKFPEEQKHVEEEVNNYLRERGM